MDYAHVGSSTFLPIIAPYYYVAPRSLPCPEARSPATSRPLLLRTVCRLQCVPLATELQNKVKDFYAVAELWPTSGHGRLPSAT